MDKNNQNAETGSFFGLGIAPRVLETLERLKFKHPTPIQQKAIPIGLAGQDVIGVAQTGTGKTLAFAIPMVQRLAQKPGRGLILVPTRELALQVEEAVQKICQPFGLKTVVLIGGASMYNQIQGLRRNPSIIVATPGRLIDHLGQGNVFLGNVHTLVLDEADRMLDMGFAPQIQKILQKVPHDRQTMLFSATIPPAIVGIARSYMKLPVSVEIAPSGTAAEQVTHEVFIVKKETKGWLLERLLYDYKGTILLFSRTKHGASRIARAIKNLGHRAAEIHSDRTLAQRREALEGFKSGKYRILVATDIAARGIDVIGIELVLNYDLPDDTDNYVHRIGRTGRAGLPGHAISFATPDQGSDVRSIEKLIRAPLPIAEHPEIPAEKFYQSTAAAPRRFAPRRGFRRRRL